MDPFADPIDPLSEWARRHVHRYVETNGEDPSEGHDWRGGAPVLLLTTLGRRSGLARRTPLIYGRDGENYLVVASRGGSDEPPSWYTNLRADPRVRLQIRGDIVDARARRASPAEQERLWPVMTALWPDYDNYQTKTERRIPVVVMEPVGSHTDPSA